MIIAEQEELSNQRENVLATVRDPQRILAGKGGVLLAVRGVSPGKYLVVVYRELADDGFIITAFLTRKVRQLDRRKQLWP